MGACLSNRICINLQSNPSRRAGRDCLIAHKPAVCGRDFPIACLRTASRASTASNRGGNVFFRFAPTLNSAWSSHTFAPPCANACAVFRPCGLRFAPCPRGSSRFAASDARRLACGTPCFIGLTSRCFAHRARASCAPRRTRRRGRLYRERASAFSCAPSGFFDSRSI